MKRVLFYPRNPNRMRDLSLGVLAAVLNGEKVVVATPSEAHAKAVTGMLKEVAQRCAIETMAEAERVKVLDPMSRPEWAMCRECGSEAGVEYTFRDAESGGLVQAYYCVPCGGDLKGVKEHLNLRELNLQAYSFDKGDRVCHVHNGQKGTIEGPQEDDYVESYWVKWDGYKRLDIVEPMFMRAEDPDHAMA